MFKHKLLFALALIALVFAAVSDADAQKRKRPPAKKKAAKVLLGEPVIAPDDMPTTSPIDGSPIEWQGFADERSGYEIEHPADWELTPMKGNEPMTLISRLEGDDDIYQENLNLQIKPMPVKGVTIRMIEEPIKTEVAKVKGYELIKLNYIKWLGVEAMQLNYKALTDNGIEFRGFQRVALKNRKIYVITYGSETKNHEKYEPIFRYISDSMRLTRK